MPNITVTWFPDNTGFSFITWDKYGKHFNQYQYSAGGVRPLFDQQRLADTLSASIGKSGGS